jgi:2-keto-4-pentenoate hydratase/2-oxohepta-3-ene-1,7-dioic acid hydratase in catechol pathway
MTEPTWSLVQYTTPSSQHPRSGIMFSDIVFTAPAHWPSTVLGILREWRALEVDLRSLAVHELRPVPDAQLTAPLTYPPKVLCAGANYYDHAAEMGTAAPDPADPPFFFTKPPTTTVVGPGVAVEIPASEDAQVDWEVELAVVIADRIRDVTPDDALAHVAGYTVANDLSARGLFPRTDAVAAPFAWDWLAHKGLDGFCPLGPGIVPAWLIDHPGALPLRLRVNGVEKQNSSTDQLVASVPALISAASRLITLEPGDVILTGTPAGVGMPRQEFLSPGDVVEAEIDGIGLLRNSIRARTPLYPTIQGAS